MDSIIIFLLIKINPIKCLSKSIENKLSLKKCFPERINSEEFIPLLQSF